MTQADSAPDVDAMASADDGGASKQVTVLDPEGDASTSSTSYLLRGTATIKEIVVTNVGGPNDKAHPDDGEEGYPEYRVTVNSDGTWEQRVAIFPGENAIFLETSGATSLAEFTIQGEGSATPPAQKEQAPDKPKRAAREPTSSRLSFSGNGGKRLGTIDVPAGGTLRWTNDGGIFQIFSENSDLFVNSQSSSGTSAVEAGTYTDVTVNAVGNWTIKIG